MKSAMASSVDDKPSKNLEEMKLQMMMTDFAQSQMQISVNRTHGYVPPIEKARQLASSAESRRQQFLEKVKREMETKKTAAAAPAPGKSDGMKKWKNIPIVQRKPKDQRARKDIKKVPVSHNSCDVPYIPGAAYELVPFKLLPSIADNRDDKTKAQHLDGSERQQKKTTAKFIPVKHTKKSAQVENRIKAKSKANTEYTSAPRTRHFLPGIVPGLSGQKKGTSAYDSSRKPSGSVSVKVSASDWSTTCIASSTPKPNESAMSTLLFPQLDGSIPGSNVLPPIGGNATPKKSELDQDGPLLETPGSTSSRERSTNAVSRRSKTRERSRSRNPPLRRSKLSSPVYPSRNSTGEITTSSSTSVTPRSSRESQRSGMRNPRVLHRCSSERISGSSSPCDVKTSARLTTSKSGLSVSPCNSSSSSSRSLNSARSNSSKDSDASNRDSLIGRSRSTKSTESAKNIGNTNVKRSPGIKTRPVSNASSQSSIQRSSSVSTSKSGTSQRNKLSPIKSHIPTHIRHDGTSREAAMSAKSTHRSVGKSSCPSSFSRSSPVSRKSSTPPASVTPRTPPSGKQSPGSVSTSVTPRTPPSGKQSPGSVSSYVTPRRPASGKQSPGSVSTYSNTSSGRTSAVSKIASPQNTRPASTTPTRKSSKSEQSINRSVGKSVCQPSKRLADAQSRPPTRSSMSTCATSRSVPLADAPSRLSTRNSSVSICATSRSRALPDAPSRLSSRNSPVSTCTTSRSRPLPDAPSRVSTRKSPVSICASPMSFIRPATPAKARGSPAGSSSVTRC